MVNVMTVKSVGMAMGMVTVTIGIVEGVVINRRHVLAESVNSHIAVMSCLLIWPAVHHFNRYSSQQARTPAGDFAD